ncbi:MAG: aminotransferase class V-fold PLP-dependent enzyme [Candidatus Moranbacteria bacterium]|nr:aminotransferase class V-fold PLP-dependent enzyme [Candidatus Moranbacteria bacterium]
MLTFNIGPSKLTKATKKDICNSIIEGVGEFSHRSREFSKISKQAIEGLRELFDIPKDYKIFYTNSATEAMQLCVGNCCEQKSYHFVCGVFSEVFAKTSELMHKKVIRNKADFGKLNNFKTARIQKDTDLITITHNETSTGVMCKKSDIKLIRKKAPKAILAVDITSSAGSFKPDIKDADVWLFSVQKCFGLPSGLGIMIVSKKAYEKSLELLKKEKNQAGYFYFENLWSKMKEKYQTPQTPNVLNIYLLAKKLRRWNKTGGVRKNYSRALKKYGIIEKFVFKNSKFDFFVKDKKVRSIFSVCLEAEPQIIEKIHAFCTQQKIILGQGYGDLKPYTFRIANFPAIKESHLKKLIKIIQNQL